MIDLAAFGAHPDDVEICVGGLLLRAAGKGYRTAVVDLTRGELATAGDVETRTKEAEQAADLLGLKERRNLDLPDGGLSHQDRDQLTEVVGEIRRLQPRVILLPFPRCHHPDHVETGLMVERASHLARIGRWGKGEDPWRPHGLLYYESRLPLRPTILVDISEVIEEKRNAIHCYRTQFDRPADHTSTELSEPGFLGRFELRSRWLGSLIGVDFAEPYLTRSPLPVDDPIAAIVSHPGPRGGLIGA